MATKTLSVVIAGDASGAQSAFKKVEADADGMAAKLANLGSKITPAMAAAAGAVAIGVGVAVKRTIDAASDLEQAVGGTSAVFGQASGKVNEFSKSAATLSGLSETAARTLTSQLGASLIGFGLSAEEAADRSVDLTKKGADLAATMGGKTSDAVSALGAAFRGEFDPLERFGIALKQSDVNAKAVSMGLAQSESSVSSYAKGQATLALITERSAFAQGQFARESDSAAGATQIAKAQLENASAQIGSALIPVVAKAAEVVGMLATGFMSLPEPVRVATLGIGAIGTAGVASVAIVAKLADTFGGVLQPAMTAVRSGLDSAAIGAANLATKMGASQESALKLATGISNLGNYAVPAIAGITAAFAIYSIAQAGIEARQKTITAGAKEYADALRSQTGAVVDNVNAVTAQKFAQGELGQILSKTDANYRVLADGIKTNEDNLDDWANLAKDSSYQGVVLGNALQDAASGGNEFASELIRLKGEMDASAFAQLVMQLEVLSTQYQQGEIDSKTYNAALEGLGLQADGTAPKVQTLADKIRDASNALRESTDPWFAAQQAQAKLASSQDAYNDAVAKFGATSPQAVEAYRQLAQSGLTYEGKLLDLSAAQEGGKTSATDLATRLQNLKALGIDPTSEAARIAGYDFLGLAGAADAADARNVEIPVSVPGIDDAIRKFGTLQQAFDRLNQQVPAYLNPGAPAYSFRLPGSAGGGGLQEGWNVVGENGPETVWKSGGMVDVYPNTKPVSGSAPMSGSGPMTVVINMPPGSNGEDVVDAIKRYERRNGTAWRN